MHSVQDVISISCETWKNIKCHLPNMSSKLPGIVCKSVDAIGDRSNEVVIIKSHRQNKDGGANAYDVHFGIIGHPKLFHQTTHG